MEQFAKRLKAKIIEEFKAGYKNGIYAFTQKYMAYNSNKIEGSALTFEQTSYLFDTGRAIIFKQFLDSNIVPVVIYNEDKHRYFHAHHTAQTEGKYDMLLELFKKRRINFTGR